MPLIKSLQKIVTLHSTSKNDENAMQRGMDNVCQKLPTMIQNFRGNQKRTAYVRMAIGLRASCLR
jgi:hypothetical protein